MTNEENLKKDLFIGIIKRAMKEDPDWLIELILEANLRMEEMRKEIDLLKMIK